MAAPVVARLRSVGLTVHEAAVPDNEGAKTAEVAALPMAVGLAGDDYRDPARFDTAYGSAMIICAVLLVLGGVVSWFAIPSRLRPTPA